MGFGRLAGQTDGWASGCVLGDDGTLKIRIYSMTWLP